MNRKCRVCGTNVPLNQYTGHMLSYHGGTADRPFGLTIAQINANVDGYIAANRERWAKAREPETCEWCNGPCTVYDSHRRRREALRQQRHREQMQRQQEAQESDRP